MGLIDDIKRDREAGTKGPFACHFGDDKTTCDCRYIFAEYGGMGSIATITVCKEEHGDWGDDFGPMPNEAKANARRIVRVPDMEAALIAAEKLADECDRAFDNINGVGPREFYIALANYRKAMGADQ